MFKRNYFPNTKKSQLNWIKQAEAAQTQSVKNDTPFLLMDLDKVSQKVKDFKDAFSECEIFYAVKAFSGDAVIDRLDDIVEGFDIASQGEMELLMEQGIDTSRMMFSNPVKKPSHIKRAYDEGVRYFAFDSVNELRKIADNAPGANVYLRVKVSDHGSAFPLSAKFGADPIHAVPFMDTARDFGLNPVGLTFHVGSQAENLHVWDVAFEICGTIMNRLSKTDIKLDFIDIGGGFPAEYTERVPNIKTIVKSIRKSVKEYLPYDVQLKAEPGRSMVAEAGLIVTSVIGREHREGTDWLYLDVGAFNGMMEPLEMSEWKYPIFTDHSSKSSSNPAHFTLTGPTCDANDTFGFAVPLPANITTGDRVYIASAGAYTTVYASTFNGFDIPKCIYINSKKA